MSNVKKKLPKKIFFSDKNDKDIKRQTNPPSPFRYLKISNARLPLSKMIALYMYM